MKLLSQIIAASMACAYVKGAVIQKRKSNSWAGTNLYLLQGLSNSDQDNYLSQLSSDGAKVVRVWVNAQPGSGCQKGVNMAQYAPDLETTIGQYNDKTLSVLDSAINKVASHGMKVIISPHDANVLNGPNGNDIYGQTYGSGYFYTDSTAAQQYDNRLSHILNYVSPSSGKAWKDWSEAIMGFDIQNEPMSVNQKYEYNDPTGWMCARAQKMRSILGGENPIKIGTGGIGGDYSHNYNFASFATNCGQIDMVSVHRYANGGWDEGDWIKDANGKLVYVEEWGVSGGSQGSEYGSNTGQMNGQGLPWMYWQVLPQKECNSQDSDQFGIYQNGGIDIATNMRSAANSQAAQDWTGIIY